MLWSWARRTKVGGGGLFVEGGNGRPSCCSCVAPTLCQGASCLLVLLGLVCVPCSDIALRSLLRAVASCWLRRCVQSSNRMPTRIWATCNRATDRAGKGRTTTSCSTRHFITGDGRGNENIGLTTVHHVFHSEHNRQVEQQKLTILASGDLAYINQWLDTDLEPADAAPGSAGVNRAAARPERTSAQGLELGRRTPLPGRPLSRPRCSTSTSCSKNSPARSSRTSTRSCSTSIAGHQPGHLRRIRARRVPLRPLDADGQHAAYRRRR